MDKSTVNRTGMIEGRAAAMMTRNQLGYARDIVAGVPQAQAYKNNYSVSPGMDNKVNLAKAASRVNRHPLVQEYIAKAREHAVVKSGIDAAWVLRETEKLYNKCLADDDNVVARSSLEMIGKNVMVKAFEDKRSLEIGGGAGSNVTFNISFKEPNQKELGDVIEGTTD